MPNKGGLKSYGGFMKSMAKAVMKKLTIGKKKKDKDGVPVSIGHGIAAKKKRKQQLMTIDKQLSK